MNLVDLLGGLTVSLGAVVFAGLAAGLFGQRFGGTFGERRGLAFALTMLLIKKILEVFDFGAEFGVFALDSQTVEARNQLHTFTVSAARFFSCASLPAQNAIFSWPSGGANQIPDVLPIFRQDRPGPLAAIQEFLPHHAMDFEVDHARCQRFLITHHPMGWLRRKP